MNTAQRKTHRALWLALAPLLLALLLTADPGIAPHPAGAGAAENSTVTPALPPDFGRLP